MNPVGVIITYVDWSKWKTWWFNIPLFLFQLTFMVVGTAIGKIRWPGRQISLFDIALSCALVIIWSYIPLWWNIPVFTIWLFIGVAIIRGIPWRRVWRAAQASHVRLVLQNIECICEPVGDDLMKRNPDCIIHRSYGRNRMVSTANFGYPKMEIQLWHTDWNDNKRFEYREPTFEPTAKFIEAMIEYAHDQEGKRYDTLQLFSYGLNLFVWLLWWPWWGKEKLKWLNLRGGREVCSSGLVACLRWAYLIRYGYSAESANKMLLEGYAEYGTIFFEGYDTAVIPPCLVPLSKNWEEVAQ